VTVNRRQHPLLSVKGQLQSGEKIRRKFNVNNIYITTHSQAPIFCIVSRVDKRYI